MPDVLLVQPPIRDFYLTAKRTIPHGLICMASALLRGGYSVDLFDALATPKSKPLELPPEFEYLTPFYGKPDISPFGLFHQYKHFGYSFEHIGNMVRASKAFLVGISSLFTAYSDEALETARAIKRFYPDCTIVMGGHHPTALPEAVMACKAVDYVIRGEGEEALPLLVEALRKGGSLYEVPGIVFRKPDGRLHISEPAVIHDLDALPLPARHLINRRFYSRKKKGSMVVMASRGCPMHCTYCSVGASSIPYRRRTVESVLGEIGETMAAEEIGFIDFEDENLSLNKKWFLVLLEGIEKLSKKYSPDSLPELRAMNGLYAPSLDEEVIKAMKRAGFQTLNLSLGSTSAKQLRAFGRPDVRASVEKAIALARKHDLEVVCYIIIGAPGQQAEDSVKDLFYLASKKVLAGVSVFYPAPGSKDYEKCRQLGLLPAHFSRMRSTALPIDHTTSRIETITLLRLGRIINFIKQLRETGERLPAPVKPGKVGLPGPMNRIDTGKMLLSFFMSDGKIKGCSANGGIYEHPVSSEICRHFLEGKSVMY